MTWVTIMEQTLGWAGSLERFILVAHWTTALHSADLTFCVNYKLEESEHCGSKQDISRGTVPYSQCLLFATLQTLLKNGFGEHDKKFQVMTSTPFLNSVCSVAGCDIRLKGATAVTEYSFHLGKIGSCSNV